MIERIIEASIRNRFLVLVIAAALTAAGAYAMVHTPVDAIPDLSENQVIVFTDWMGRSPREIEDQVTYPLSLKLKGLAGVRAVRSSSEFNFSMITLIFDDDVDFYFARQRVTEKLTQAATFLPPGVTPYMAPDATALGQIFWYTVENSPAEPVDSARLWALNKFYIAPQLNAAAGVADVAVVGGTPLEYQIDVRPEALRAYGITLGELYAAVAQSNMPAGGGVVQKNNAEYIVRGVGWIEGRDDIENTVVKEVNRVPVYVRSVASVQLGTQFRRSVYEKDGNEVTGGAVLMRHGENPLDVTERVKEKIRELQPGLPAGVHIVPAYDRTRLIRGAIHTLGEVMWHEMLIASLAILLILSHVRSVLVICITLPLAVLFSFLAMWLLRVLGVIDIQANIMSLAGITISIGILVDQAIVMTENATHALKEHFGDRKVSGDIRELVIPACRTVGRPIFFSVMIMLISFIPVFMLSGREGKYFHPLAFTKSFALLGVAIISITLVPALIPTFIKGRLRSEEENWIVRSFIQIYKPLLTWALPRRNLVMWMFAVLLILAAGMFPLQALVGQGASEIAWRRTFLGVFAIVTSLTVILITGKRASDVKGWLLDLGLVALALGLLATTTALVRAGIWIGLSWGEFIVPVWIIGGIDLVKCFKWLVIACAGVPLVALIVAGYWTQRRLLWRTMTLASLVAIGLWAYHFTKIGVAFMPALDEGTTLDMPITVPRASVTQAADDLKARDALLRGFPEVESVIGKAGRADTPTDPAPLDMVETFVNFRPKELWPKRVLKFNDARRQMEFALRTLTERGYLGPVESEDRDSFLNNATQKALERFDETMRELALQRYQEFEAELPGELTRFAVGETLRRIGASMEHQDQAFTGNSRLPPALAGGSESQEIAPEPALAALPNRASSGSRSPAKAGSASADDSADHQLKLVANSGDSICESLTRALTPTFTAKYGRWLAANPSLEDVTELSRDAANALKDRGAIDDVVGALELKESLFEELLAGLNQAFGGQRKTLAGELLHSVERERTRLWREQVQRTNWELFDRGAEAFCWYALEELAKGGKNGGLTENAAHAAQTERFAAAAIDAQLDKSFDPAAMQPFIALREEFEREFKRSVFLWPRQTGPKGDLVDDEMGRVLQVPGWSNIFTQPIINRIEMLSTGVRTDIGVKVFGPDLETIERVSKQVETALKPLAGARDVIAAPFMGKGYLQIKIDREKAARYGISVADVENEIEVALAGRAITYTVEDRNRFPVRIRYVRSQREDEESVRRLLVSPGGMAPEGGGEAMAAETMSGGTNAGERTSLGPNMTTTRRSAGHAASPVHAARGKPLIPLSAVADVQVVEGPAMIKSENSRLVNYVTLNVRGRDIVGFVDEAQRAVAAKVELPEGVHIEWSGEFEHQVRAAKTLRYIFPTVFVLIFIILYLTYNDLADAVLMVLAVPEALAGGAFFLYLFPKIVHGWETPPMDFSVAVWVGFIACFGMATETGIIMLVYLREAIEKRGGLEKIESLAELRQAVIEGAVHRLRPKLLTEGVAIIAIFPMVFAKGVGGEILAPMALPVLGGLLISDEVVDLFLPVRFYWVRRGRWLKLHAAKSEQSR